MPFDPTVAGYIDAGTGSYLLAAIAGGFATMWFFIRAKFAALFGRKPAPESAAQAPVRETVTEPEPVADGGADSTTFRE
jgi:hypothetical protein